MRHAVNLFVVLAAVWLLLSGFFTPFLLTLGVISCVLVVAIARRMDVLDNEGRPIYLSWRFLVYLPWLGWQIALANVDVARRVLGRRLAIDPVVHWVPSGQRSDLGTVLYANSITLTPGTVSTTVESGRIEVHALTASAMADLETGAMHRRVQSVGV